jgi:SAM-dependent methyltransferase
MSTLSESHWESLVDRLGLAGVGEVLDVACGSGDWLAPLARVNKRLVGIDSDTGMVELAQARSSGAPNIDIRSMSAESLDFPDGDFDAVTCLTALPYLDQSKALAEMSRVLRPGGRLVVGTVGPGYYAKHVSSGVRHQDAQAISYGLDALIVTAGRAVRGDRFAPSSLKAWSPRAVRKLLTDHGFDVADILRDVTPVNPSWPTSSLGLPVYFVAFATKPVAATTKS